MLTPFDGFHETPHAVTGACLISFDRNRYSVRAPTPCGLPHGTPGKAVRRAVQVRAYADRIIVRLGDEVVAEHPRFFGRDRMILDPWRAFGSLDQQRTAQCDAATLLPELRSYRANCHLIAFRRTRESWSTE